jgi:hypothetical protein
MSRPYDQTGPQRSDIENKSPHQASRKDTSSVEANPKQSMKKALFLVLIVAVVAISALVVRALQSESRSPSPFMAGAIVMQRLNCGEAVGGRHEVRVAGFNHTDRDLLDVRVEFSVGHGEEIVTAVSEVDFIAQGGVLNLQRDVPFDGDVDVCFVKFFHGTTQIPATFRP